MVFWGFVFFEVLILKMFVFGVSGIVSKVLKMLVFFPSYLGFFCGVASSCLIGFGRFRCFYVSSVCFSYLCCFCFCFVCFVFVLLLVCVGCWFLFCFFFCFFFVFFVFVFFCLFVFVSFLFFVLFLFLFFGRV